MAILLFAKAGLGFVAGWGLLQQEKWARTLALVLAFVSLFTNIPFGTALGVYTMWVLLPAESEREYEALTATKAAKLFQADIGWQTLGLGSACSRSVIREGGAVSEGQIVLRVKSLVKVSQHRPKHIRYEKAYRVEPKRYPKRGFRKPACLTTRDVSRLTGITRLEARCNEIRIHEAESNQQT